MTSKKDNLSDEKLADDVVQWLKENKIGLGNKVPVVAKEFNTSPKKIHEIEKVDERLEIVHLSTSCNRIKVKNHLIKET